MAVNNKEFVESVAWAMNVVKGMNYTCEAVPPYNVPGVDHPVGNNYMYINIVNEYNDKLWIVVCSDGTFHIDFPREMEEFVECVCQCDKNFRISYKPIHSPIDRIILGCVTKEDFELIFRLIYAAFALYAEHKRRNSNN